MKTIALVGFTREDALSYVFYEARCLGNSAMVSADGKTVTLAHERYVILGPKDSLSDFDRVVFDEIIERQAA